MIYRPLCLLLRNKTSRWLLFLVNCYYTVHHAALTRILQIYFTMLLVLQLPRVILWLRHRLNYVRTRVSVHRTRRYFVLRASSSKRASVNKQEGLEIEVKSTAGHFFLAIKMNTSFTHVLKIFLFFFFYFWKLQFISISHIETQILQQSESWKIVQSNYLSFSFHSFERKEKELVKVLLCLNSRKESSISNSKDCKQLILNIIIPWILKNCSEQLSILLISSFRKKKKNKLVKVLFNLNPRKESSISNSKDCK